jgi:hypothetical protein
VTKIGELGRTQAATSYRRTLRRNTNGISVLTRATRRNNPEDTILHSHRRENLKSYNKYDPLLLILARYSARLIFQTKKYRGFSPQVQHTE